MIFPPPTPSKPSLPSYPPNFMFVFFLLIKINEKNTIIQKVLKENQKKQKAHRKIKIKHGNPFCVDQLLLGLGSVLECG